MNNGKILLKNSKNEPKTNHPCYIINQDHLFLYEGPKPSIEYQGHYIELSRKQAKVLKYLCSHPNPLTIDQLIKANWPVGGSKEKLMKLVFELNQKFIHVGLPHAGISLNGDEYQLNYDTELSYELEYYLKRMQKQKLWIRLFVFIAVALMLGLNLMP